VEEFFVRRRLRGMDFRELSARQVEAFVILEQAFAAELPAGQHCASGAAALPRWSE
jgi:hypothetical protein